MLEPEIEAPPVAADEKMLIEVGCRSLGVPLEQAWLESIALHVQVMRQHGKMLLNPPLRDRLDPGPVFEP